MEEKHDLLFDIVKQVSDTDQHKEVNILSLRQSLLRTAQTEDLANLMQRGNHLFHVALDFEKQAFATVILQTLIFKGTDLNRVTDAKGRTPMHTAAYAGNITLIQMILDKDKLRAEATQQEAEVLTEKQKRKSKKEKTGTFSLPKTEPYDAIEVADNEGNSALHWAVIGQQLDAVAKLLQSGAKATVQNKKGETPLHLAIRHYPEDISKVRAPALVKAVKSYQDHQNNCFIYHLIKYGGADVRTKDQSGKDALTLAKDLQLTEAAMELERALFAFQGKYTPPVKEEPKSKWSSIKPSSAKHSPFATLHTSYQDEIAKKANSYGTKFAPSKLQIGANKQTDSNKQTDHITFNK